MKPFRRRRRGGLVATFDAGEAHLLANLSRQIIELLRDRNGESESSADPLAAQLGMGGPSTPPDDPVLARLLPDAYPDDAEEAGEFRRFTEQSLTSTKVSRAEVVIGSLVDGGLDPDRPQDVAQQAPVEIELDPAAVQAWLTSLTDIRLAVAIRLGIETDDDLEILHHTGDEAQHAMTEIYDWLGYVQESLVSALD